MTQKKPGDMSDLPRMVPDRDDIARRRKGGGSTPPGGGSGDKTAPVSGPHVWPLYTLFVLLAGGVGYLGYELHTSQTTLAATEQSLSGATDRIEELEQQLSATDESLTMNESAIQSNFNNILAEIRRLWDVADNRNLDWIRENQSAIASLEDSLGRVDELESLTANLDEQTGQQASAINTLTDTMDDQNDSLQTLIDQQAELADTVTTLASREEEVSARLDIVTMRIEGAVELTTEMSQQLNQLDQSLTQLDQQLTQEAEARASLSDSVSQIRSRVATLEQNGTSTDFEELVERVNLIDNARGDTIQRLSSLQSQIRDLQDRIENSN